jgi:hypothetical protein
MTVTGVNLIPVARREAKQQQTRVRLWLSGCFVYAALWIAAFVAAKVVVGSEDRVLRAKFVEASAQVQETENAVAALRGRIGRDEVRLASGQAVGEQPDWSLLLAMLSSALGDETVLRSVRLKAPPEAAPGGPDAGGASDAAQTLPPITLDLTGLGRTQQVVTEFVLRLEQMPLFKQIRLVDTRREPFLNNHAVLFRIECVLDADVEL